MAHARMRLAVANDLAALPALADAAQAFLLEWSLPADDRADLLVILDEVASNIVRHAWPDGAAHCFIVELRAEVSTEGVAISLHFEDDGTAFDPTQAPPNTDPLLDARRPAGGFGVHLATNLADHTRYRRVATRNHLLVVKRVRRSGSTLPP